MNYKESKLMGADQFPFYHNEVEELNSALPRTNPDSSRVEV